MSSILTRLRHFFDGAKMAPINGRPHSEEVLAGFENVSQAIMAEQALTQQGFHVRVMPMPSRIRAGCGFCLRFLPEDLGRAASFLSEHGLPIKEAWEKSPDTGQGSYRKVFFDKE